VNKEYETVFKCTNADVAGKSYADVLPLELAQRVWESERVIIETGQTLHTETIVQREDGPHVYLVIRSPLLDENGVIAGTCGVGLDVTQNKLLEKEMRAALIALRISEERWAFALEGSGDSVYDCDIPNGKVQLATRWKEMLGYIDAEIGDDVVEWASRIHPDDTKKVMDEVQEVLDGRHRSFAGEYRLQHKNGHYLWVLDRGMVVQRDDGGTPLRMVGTHTNITQRKQMDTIKTEFISTVSHELRTPLTSIRGSLGLLEAGVLGALPVKALDMIKVANKNSQRLITLVNDILDMDKLLSGKMAMQSEVITLSEVIAHAVEANAAYAANYQVRFSISPCTINCQVIGDANRLMQVITNLLSNAAKFSHPGDIVEIRQRDAGAFLRVEVEDRGEGIPLAFQPRIFEAFSQADSANTRRQGSTGLGLNISKKLIEQMGGEVGYTTEINCGTTFWFTVPLANQ
jgi:PAS domain S-box-containing protein